MFVVIFEVQPKPDLTDEYLKLAQHLKPMLEKIDGFLDVERFASGRTEGRLLSLSTWRDEKALVRWRTHAEHHRVQAKGRSQVFEDYRLRVGEVTADTQPPEGIAIEQTRLDETAIGAAKVMTITETIVDPKIAAAPDALGSGGAGRGGNVREHLQPGQDRPPRLLARRGGSANLEADRIGRLVASPSRPHHPRLRHVRAPRSAAILSGAGADVSFPPLQ